MVCPKCGTNLAAKARFCNRCGAKTAGEEINTPVTKRTEGLEQTDSGKPAPGTGLYPGQVIDSRYRIDGLLGAGGMGEVYRATRLMIGDEVAIKVLHKELVSDRLAIERFRREAQAAARLKHPNAVTIYDFGVSSENLVYLVMELVEGKSLRNIIRQQGPMKPQLAATLISQVAAALDEAHHNKIVHRDLKPDNIIVTESQNGPRVKVLDFGIAKLRDMSASVSTLTIEGTVMGTPHYMSPEQCKGEEIDGRSDIYSLGVVLYEMLVGVVPFNSPTVVAVIMQHVNQAPPPLPDVNPDITPAVELVVMRALEKQREQRPQTAREFAMELNDAVRQPVSVTQVAPSTVPPVAYGGGTAPGLAPTVDAVQPFHGGKSQTPWSGNQAAVAPPKNKSALRAVLITLVIMAIAGGGAAIYLLTRNKVSPHESILAEIRAGNLVKPEGASAYDLFKKYAGSLTGPQKTEITNLAASKLEKRGSEIINRLKQEEDVTDAEWGESVRVYSWLAELKPGSTNEARKFFSSGRLALENKDYNKALADFQRSIQLEPKWAMSLNGIARAYVGLKDSANADLYYSRALEIEPDWIVVWINRAALQLDGKNYLMAVKYIRRAIELDQNRASAHYLYGQILDKQALDICDALREYQIAIKNTPTDTSPKWIDTAKQRVSAIQSKNTCR